MTMFAGVKEPYLKEPCQKAELLAFPVFHFQCNNQAVSDKCTCSASLCRHPLNGCPNPPVVELTVSAMRGSKSEG